MPATLPLELLLDIAQCLEHAEMRGTLAALARASRPVYDLVEPLLYRELVVDGERAASLAVLAERWQREYRQTKQVARQAARVRTLTLRALPPDDTSARLLAALSRPAVAAVRHVALAPGAARQLKQWEAYRSSGFPSRCPHAGSMQHPLHALLHRLAPPRLTVHISDGEIGQWGFAVNLFINALCAAWPLETATFIAGPDPHCLPHCVPGAHTTYDVTATRGSVRVDAMVHAQLRRVEPRAAAGVEVRGADGAAARREAAGKGVWLTGVAEVVAAKVVFVDADYAWAEAECA